MAQSYNEINFNNTFKNLPIELKNIVISYSNIKNLISYKDTEVCPLIDDYIKKYIETSLLTDASVFTFLRRSVLYGHIINTKIRKMATVCAKEFLQQCQILYEKPDIEKNNRCIFFNIKYNHGHKYNNNKLPKITCFRNNYDNNLSIILNRDNSIRTISMTELNIISEIIDALCHFMDNFREIYQVHSIELVETIISQSNIFESSKDARIIKKYY